MKKHLYSIFSLLLCVAIVGCTEDFKELDKGHDTLTLSSSAEEIVLNETSYGDNAIALNWTTGTNYGTGNRISYTLEIAKSGTGFANAYTTELGIGVYAWARSVQQLNTLLKNELGIGENETVTLEARITATVADRQESEKQTSVVSFSVKTYQPVATTLYMIGDATPTGWSADSPTVMERTDVGLFEWTGRLSSSGGFKFITTLGKFLPSYNRDASVGGLKLVYRSSDSQADEKFSVDADATYTVKADLLKLTVTITESQGGWRFDDVYFVGSFTGWGFVPMTKDILRENLFHYGEVFEWSGGGEFKFGTVQGWDNMLFATTNNAPYTSTGVIYNNSQDTKWLLNEDECGKAYKIALDVANGSEKMIMKPFTPYGGLYLVGSAAPSGWDIANATAMIQSGDSPYIFTWTGSLAEGELKITCDKKSDWNGAWFMSDKNGKEPTGEKENMVFVDKSDNEFKALYPDVNINDVDMKWVVSQAGTYTITADQLRGTITIVR